MIAIPYPRNIGKLIRSQRKEQGLTQRQLAAKAGVSERLIASLELGDATGIRLDKLLPILDALELSLFVSTREEKKQGSSPASATLLEKHGEPLDEKPAALPLPNIVSIERFQLSPALRKKIDAIKHGQ